MRTFLICALLPSLILDAGRARAATAVTAPAAVAKITESEYCFAVPRGLRPERQPMPILILQVHLAVSYGNSAARPIILPLEYERTVYTALMPGVMKATHDAFNLFAPTIDTMRRLPANVNPDNPVDPHNDVFRVIPAGGVMTPSFDEVVTMPVVRTRFGSKVDLRGHSLYLRLKLRHRALDPGLEASLSDKWARFGAPWTGTSLTNTLLINVPASPTGGPCVDRK